MGQGTQQEGLDSVKSGSESKLQDRRHIRARQRAIGREIGRFFKDVIEEGIPPEMRDLVRQIDSEAEGALPPSMGS